MPELPEVETVVRTLEYQLGHRTIQSVMVLWDNLIDNVSIKDFKELLVNQTFEKYDRRGKFLIFTLSDYILIAHLRMEGKFYYYVNGSEPVKHTHIIFKLDQGELHYNDVRKFGRFYLYAKNEPLKALDKLGYEPFDEKLTPAYCRAYCKNNTKPIKQTLLDQSMIAGIGNIYANEICFASRINPFHPSNQISLETWEKIIDATKRILKDAIKAGGTTIRSYTSSLGVNGLFQQYLYVHSRVNQPCLVCGADIVKTKIDGRGTYYCPCCQNDGPLLVAITGSIGSGKSEVTHMLSQKGFKTISCDDVNRDLLIKEETIKALAGIFDCDYQQVTKAYISEQIFSNDEIKKKVEEYLHKQIWQEIQNWINNNCDEEVLFVEVPLLFETNWYERFETLVTVYCNEKILYERLKKYRQMSEDEITERLSKQLPIKEKIKMADLTICNDGSLDMLVENLDKVLEKIIDRK